MTTTDVFLLVLGAVAVGSGARVVSTRHVVRAGLWLVVTLGAVAGAYLLLAAELVAWVQVLLYVGAVVVLLLFAVMLTRAPIGASADLDRDGWAGALVGTGAGLGLTALFLDGYRWQLVDRPAVGSAQLLGTQVFRNWVLPFEVVSVLLLAALIGAVVSSRPPQAGRAVNPVRPPQAARAVNPVRPPAGGR